MDPTNEQPLHADISVGDTVYSNDSYGWHLWGKPGIAGPYEVLKKSASGRLAVTDRKRSTNYTDRLYFKTPEGVLGHYKELAEKKLVQLHTDIERTKAFIEKCDPSLIGV